MRSGRGSLTGTVASAVTKLDTLDAPAIRADSKDRTGIARDQRSRWTGRYEPARPSISASSAGAPSRACQSNINLIPIKTDCWDIGPPNFTEADLISHLVDSADRGATNTDSNCVSYT